jgi:hypothetical protein
MSTLNWPPKDPNELLDYSINWTNRLDRGDIIVDSSWTVPSTIVRYANAFSQTLTTIWLSGGTVSSTPVAVTNQITTQGGRIMEQTVNIKIVTK